MGLRRVEANDAATRSAGRRGMRNSRNADTIVPWARPVSLYFKDILNNQQIIAMTALIEYGKTKIDASLRKIWVTVKS